MRVLRFLENRFDELSFKVKLELFIFPFVLVVIFFYFFENPKKELGSTFFSKNVEKRMDKNILDIVQDIENIARDCNIEIINITTNKKRIELEILASKKKQVSFLNRLEYYNSFSKVKELNLDEKSFFVILDFNKFYVKKEAKKIVKGENIDLKLQAIVNNKAFINESWFRLNESIGSFKIVSISKRKVTLDNGFKVVELSLNEYL